MKKILIADDQSDVRFLIKVILEREGYEVIEASDGSTAYKILVSEKPALAILDVAMPIKNGISLLSEIKKNETIKNIPVIITSSYEDLAQISTASDIKPDAIIEKLSIYKELTSKIKELLSK